MSKSSYLNTLKNNPIKTMLLVFALLFIFFIIIFVSSVFRNNRRFYFENTDNFLYQSKLNDASDFSDYLTFDNFNVTLTKYDNDDFNHEFFGNYRFNISYTQDKSYTISFKFVLMADWSATQTAPKLISPNNAKDNITTIVSYLPNDLGLEKDFPKARYLFFKINKPSLYLEINVSRKTSSSGLPIEFNETFYYRYDFTINVIN